MGFFRLPNSKVFSKKSTKFAELVCAEKLAEATWALCQDVVKGIHPFLGRTSSSPNGLKMSVSYKISQVFWGTVIYINIYIYMEIQNPMKFMMILPSCRTKKCFSLNLIGNPKNNTVEIHFLEFLAPESFANHHQPPPINTSSRNCEGIARAAQELLNAHGFAHTRFPWPKCQSQDENHSTSLVFRCFPKIP